MHGRILPVDEREIIIVVEIVECHSSSRSFEHPAMAPKAFHADRGYGRGDDIE